jgi:hypothetical protein
VAFTRATVPGSHTVIDIGGAVDGRTPRVGSRARAGPRDPPGAVITPQEVVQVDAYDIHSKIAGPTQLTLNRLHIERVSRPDLDLISGS